MTNPYIITYACVITLCDIIVANGHATGHPINRVVVRWLPKNHIATYRTKPSYRIHMQYFPAPTHITISAHVQLTLRLGQVDRHVPEARMLFHYQMRIRRNFADILYSDTSTLGFNFSNPIEKASH
jgi:hypothetical protein